jgi:hypothetical protein
MILEQNVLKSPTLLPHGSHLLSSLEEIPLSATNVEERHTLHAA